MFNNIYALTCLPVTHKSLAMFFVSFTPIQLSKQYPEKEYVLKQSKEVTIAINMDRTLKNIYFGILYSPRESIQ